jgi:hypothetical protein
VDIDGNEDKEIHLRTAAARPAEDWIVSFHRFIPNISYAARHGSKKKTYLQ